MLQAKSTLIADKRQQFHVQIRKKTNRERISTMRGMLFSGSSDQRLALEKTKQILLEKGITRDSIALLKPLSIEAEAACELLPFLDQLCDAALLSQQTPKSLQFQNAMTILINMSAFMEITVQERHYQEIAKMILKPEREHLVLWFLSNLLLRKNDLCHCLMEYLLQINIVHYIAERVKKNFQEKAIFQIFNGFCCHILLNSEQMTLQQFKGLLTTLEKIQDFGMEETDWELSLSLIDYAPHISVHNYELFSRKMFKRFQEYCKLKKTSLIKNYLEMILTFIRSDSDKGNYQRLQKYGIFDSFNYCLLNRFPDIKRQLAEIGCALIVNYQSEINLILDDFYTTLAMQIENIQKYQQETQIKLLMFIEKMIFLSSSRKCEQELLNMIEKAQIGYHLVNIIRTDRELVTSLCLRILQVVMPISMGIRKDCESESLFLILESQTFKNKEIKIQVIDFLNENL